MTLEKPNSPSAYEWFKLAYIFAIWVAMIPVNVVYLAGAAIISYLDRQVRKV